MTVDETFTPPWPPEEVERKTALLEPPRQLTDREQMAIRCAECVLARPVFGEDEPNFTLTEIKRCTGVGANTVERLGKYLVSQKVISWEKAPDTTFAPAGGPPSYVATPIEKAGDSFFRPAPKPGCKRTTVQNIFEAARSGVSQILPVLGDMVAAGTEITRPAIRERIELSDTTLYAFFKTLLRTKLLEATGQIPGSCKGPAQTCYQPTARGLWLLGQIADEYPPEAQDRLKLLVGEGLPPAFLERLRELYPLEMQERIGKSIVHNLRKKVVELVMPESEHQLTPSLQFTSKAKSILDTKGTLAVAHYLGIDPLLYGKRSPASHIRRIFGIPEHIDVSQFIARQHYEPLLQSLRSDCGAKP